MCAASASATTTGSGSVRRDLGRLGRRKPFAVLAGLPLDPDRTAQEVDVLDSQGEQLGDP